MSSRSRAAFTLIELLIVVAIMGILAAILLPALARAREASRRSSCLNNLKQMGVAMTLYTDEHEGHFPPKASRVRSFMVAYSTLFPEYLSDVRVLVCPSDSRQVQDELVSIQEDAALTSIQRDDLLSVSYSYVYLGFVTLNESDCAGWRWYIEDLKMNFGDQRDVVDFCEDAEIPESAVWPTSLSDQYGHYSQIGATGSNGQSTLFAIKEGIQRFVITDVNSSDEVAFASSVIPIMWDAFAQSFDGVTTSNRGYGEGVANFNHVPGGANVLYMDGHAGFVAYPTRYPVTAWVACEQNNSRFGGGNINGL